VANALIAEAIGTKLFSLEGFLGLHPANFALFSDIIFLWHKEFENIPTAG